MQLGVALDATKKYPYFRAVLAEKILSDLETYFETNSVRSDALGTFLTMALMKLVGDDRFMNDLVWNDLTIAVHFDEMENDDAPPRPMPSRRPDQMAAPKDVQVAVGRLTEMLIGGDEIAEPDKILPKP